MNSNRARRGLAGFASALRELPGKLGMRPAPRSLTGAVVLITGGSRGLGLELARVYGERGARLAICARDPDELDRAVEDLRGRGFDAHAFVVDLSDKPSVVALVDRVQKDVGPIDVLVNNAGRIQVGPFETMDDRDFEDAMDVHLYGPLWAMRAVLPSMRERGGGSIVNIASIGGVVSVPHLVPYSTSKFALVGLSQGLHAELAHEGIRVTTVCPGLMRTGSPERALFKSQYRKEYAWFVIADSLRLTSVSVRSAAERVVKATERAEAFVIVSPQAKAIALLNGVFPSTTAAAMSLVSRLLPGPGGIGREQRTGAQSHSKFSPRVLRDSTMRAAREQNELEPRPM